MNRLEIRQEIRAFALARQVYVTHGAIAPAVDRLNPQLFSRLPHEKRTEIYDVVLRRFLERNQTNYLYVAQFETLKPILSDLLREQAFPAFARQTFLENCPWGN